MAHRALRPCLYKEALRALPSCAYVNGMFPAPCRGYVHEARLSSAPVPSNTHTRHLSRISKPAPRRRVKETKSTSDPSLVSLSQTQAHTHTEAQTQAQVQAQAHASWEWLPPQREDDKDENAIPVQNGVLLSTEEVVYALNKAGGIDTQVVELADTMDTITHMVFTTGRTKKHLMKMGELLVKALKQRDLQQAPGIDGIEGADCDDWMCVDCFNILVHLMFTETRSALNLEAHWSSPKRLQVSSNGWGGANRKKHDANMDELVAANPVPDTYENHGGSAREDDVQIRRIKSVKRL